MASAIQKYLYRLLLGLLIVLWSCTAPEDTSDLTPLPTATLLATQAAERIATRLQAVTAARAMLDTTRLHFTGEPQVLAADELSLKEARTRLGQAGNSAAEGRPEDTTVWLVIFEGDWQVIPPDPDHNITPEPLFHGCVFAMIDADETGWREVATVACPRGKSGNPVLTP